MKKDNDKLKVIKLKSQGTIRQKTKGGFFYLRVTIAKGIRKEFSLKTTDVIEAKKKADEIIKVLEADTKEVAFAQINAIKGFSKVVVNLPFSEIWERYNNHPDRATPHTISEHESYHSTLNEFIRFITTIYPQNKKVRVNEFVSEIDAEICEAFNKNRIVKEIFNDFDISANEIVDKTWLDYNSISCTSNQKLNDLFNIIIREEISSKFNLFLQHFNYA